MLGIDGRTPLAIREKYALLEVPWQLEGVEEMVLLSTCQRREAYLVGEERAIREAERVLFPGGVEKGAFLRLSGKEVVYRLFRVACGVESLAVGESQVLGQVKQSWERAQKSGWCGKNLGILFLRAVTLGKKARTRTALGSFSLSVASLAVQFAEDFLGGLQGKRIFLIGTGEMARLLLRYLLERGTGEIRVSSKNPERAEMLRGEFPDIRVVSYTEKYEHLKGCDMLVSASEAPHYTVDFFPFRAIEPQAPRFLLDLGLPRNIDPKIATIEGVKLCTLEDLEKIAEENRLRRVQELGRVETLIEEEVRRLIRFWEWEELCRVFREDLEELARKELVRLLDQLPSLNQREWCLVEESLKRLSGRFLGRMKKRLQKEGIHDSGPKKNCPSR